MAKNKLMDPNVEPPGYKANVAGERKENCERRGQEEAASERRGIPFLISVDRSQTWHPAT